MSIRQKLLTIQIIVALFLFSVVSMISYQYYNTSKQVEVIDHLSMELFQLSNVNLNLGRQMIEVMDFLLGEEDAQAEFQELDSANKEIFQFLTSSLGKGSTFQETDSINKFSNEYVDFVKIVDQLWSLTDINSFSNAYSMLNKDLIPKRDKYFLYDVAKMLKNKQRQIDSSYNYLLRNKTFVFWMTEKNINNVNKARSSFAYYLSIEQVVADLNLLNHNLLDYILLQDEESKSIIDYYDIKINHDIHEVVDVIYYQNDLGMSGEQENLEEIESILNYMLELSKVIDKISDLVETGNVEEAFELKLKEYDLLLDGNVEPSLVHLLDDARSEISYTNKAFLNKVLSSTKNGVLVLICLILIFWILIRTMVKNMVVSLGKLNNAVEKLGEGGLGYRLDISSSDEFGVLADSFNEMAGKMEVFNNDLIASKEYTDQIIHTMKDILFVTSMDGNITRVNMALCVLLGYKEYELIGSHSNVLFKGSDIGISELKKMAKIESLNDREAIFITKSGVNIDMVFSCSLLEVLKEESVRLVCVGQNVTKRKKAEAALIASEERYSLAVKGANDGLWDWDMESDTVFFSERWKKMLGYNNNEVGNLVEEWFSRTHPEDLKMLYAAIDTHLKSQNTHLEIEFRMITKNNEVIWVLCRGQALWDEKGTAYRLSGSNADITDRKRLEQQLDHDTYHDSLTGLVNRSFFMERLEYSLRCSKNGKYLFAVLALNVDRFKVINDSMGHFIGDKLLVLVARRLEKAIRPGDTLARMGGDEFAVLLDDMNDIKDATRVTDRIAKAFEKPFLLNQKEVVSSVSIGVVQSVAGYQYGEYILRDADISLNSAKKKGGATCQRFDEVMYQGQGAIKTLKRESCLRDAIENEELSLVYMPIVSIQNSKITGVEPFVRWNHTTEGMLLSEEFMPIAENTGMIIPIGKWVIETSLKDLASWKQLGFNDIELSINCSLRQLHQGELVEYFRDVFKTVSVNPEHVIVDITEKAAIESAALTTTTLKALNKLGMKIAINGPADTCLLTDSLDFTVNILKLDRLLISQIAQKNGSGNTINSAIGKAHDLHMKVVAKGVETHEQMSFLKNSSCDMALGYLYSKPLNFEGLTQLLKDGQPKDNIVNF